MKYGAVLFISLFFITSCGKEAPVSYQVPKPLAPSPSIVQTLGSEADNQAVQAAHAVRATKTPTAFDFVSELPLGWTELPGTGMREVSYVIEETSIDFYLIRLFVSDVLSMVNRWRKQVGLPPESLIEIEQDIEIFHVDGNEVKYIEIYNPEVGKGILVFMVDRAPQYGYFTAKGLVGELKVHAADLRTFIESIKIK